MQVFPAFQSCPVAIETAIQQADSEDAEVVLNKQRLQLQRK